MAKSPLAQVVERFGDKAKLVAALEKLALDDLWIDRLSREKKSLAHVSSRKLLRLHDALGEVRSRFGDRFKLVEAILGLEKRAKDDGYRKHLQRWPAPRLLDRWRSLSRRERAAGTAKAEAAPAKAAPRKRAPRPKTATPNA